MARINVEDSIYLDARFSNLIEKLDGREMAIGCLIFAWRLAQVWWKTPERFIPKKEWDRLKGSKALLETEFAEMRDDKVYMCGSENQFAWLTQRQNAGKNGGLAKSRNHSGILLADASGAQRALASSSSSFSNTKNKSSPMGIGGKFDFESIYKKYPRKLGKQKGLERCKTQIRSQEDLEALSTAVDNYNAFLKSKQTEEKYIKYFDSFMSTWRDWLDPETGSTKKTTELKERVL